MKKKEIETKEDVALMVDLFYTEVVKDKLLGPVFNEIAKVDWDTHLPKMYTFWESQLFDKNTYQGNPMAVHKHLNTKHPLNSSHFKKWIALFNKNIDDHFTGERAEKAKQRALSILTVLEIKICHKS